MFLATAHVSTGLIVIVLAVAGAATPLPGRGPTSKKRDSWRSFRYQVRDQVLRNAQHRCEAPEMLVFGRCHRPAHEVDHVYPWSRGGPTVQSNAQALCKSHNRIKGALTPPWWYIVMLEKRRRTYFPTGADVRVFARYSRADLMERGDLPGQRRRRWR